MLAAMSVSETEQTVYTVPSNKKAMVYVDIYTPSDSMLVTLKVNDLTYYSGHISGVFSVKLVLTSGDVIKVSAAGMVNVFVHGLEL